jgi:hypothetical protein
MLGKKKAPKSQPNPKPDRSKITYRVKEKRTPGIPASSAPYRYRTVKTSRGR